MSATAYGAMRCGAGTSVTVLGHGPEDLAQIGATGCGFEQHLLAMRRALENNPANAGFLRDNAFLAVIFIADEDDCTFAKSAMLGPESDLAAPGLLDLGETVRRPEKARRIASKAVSPAGRTASASDSNPLRSRLFASSARLPGRAFRCRP